MAIPARGLLAALAFGAIGLSAGADPDEAPEAGPCDGPEYHAFDFWIGEWDVHDPDGVFQGENIVTAEEGGCLILERWTSEHGSTGQSYNFYMPNTETWRQVWVSPDAVIDYTGNPLPNGDMVLVGKIAYRNGNALPFTGRWEQNEDGSITQRFQQYDPVTGEWADWFTGIYTRRDGEGAG